MRNIDADLLKENIRRHCIFPAWVYTLIDAEIDGQPTAVPAGNINDGGDYENYNTKRHDG